MVSVVLPSYDRFATLVACLKSVGESRPLPVGGLETVVVTAGYTQQELAAIRATGAKLIVLARRAPVSASRNAGAAAASGDHLLFLDDDNTVAPDAISELHRALESWPDAVMVGPIMYFGSQPGRIWCAGVDRSRLLMKTTLRTSLPEPIPDRLPSQDFPNCFMVRRNDFEAVKGFDSERFPMHYEEADLARRLVMTSGQAVYLVTAARVWHHIEMDLVRRLHLSDASRARWAGQARPVFTALYGTRLQWWTYLVVGQWVFGFVYVGAALLARTRKSAWPIVLAYVAGVYSGDRRARALRRRPASASDRGGNVTW